MKQLFRRTFSCRCRKSLYAGEWSRQAPMAKSAPTAATTALRRLSFAANVAKCFAEFTGTITAANPSSGAASVGWSRPGRNLKCSQFPSCVDFTGFNCIQNCVYCYYLSFFSKIALKHRPHYFHI